MDKPTPPRRLIRSREVETMTACSRPHIDKLERAGLFPKRVKIVPGATARNSAVAWYSDEIEAWVNSRREATAA